MPERSQSDLTRIAIAGAAGRMGCALVRCSREFAGKLKIAAAIERSDCPSVGRDAGVCAGIGDIGVRISSPESFPPGIDVLVDFSSPAAVPANVKNAANRGVAVVLGTTGLDGSQREAVLKAAKKVPIVWAPNMSLGVNILFALARKSAEILGVKYDVEIVEVHHRHKKDAPSGTAIRLAEDIAMSRKQNPERVVIHGRSGNTGERPEGQIGIHAVRMGDVIGDHTVSFAVDGEKLELSHRATSRDAFAMGALHAAAWVVNKRPAIYDMQNVLGLA